MSINQLLEIKKDANLLSAAWLRQLLTLASGALAILAGLAPHTTSRTGMYFLAATWIFLGLGIIFGSSATYLEVSRANNLALALRSEIEQSIRAGKGDQVTTLVVANPHKFYPASKYVMVFSLLLSVVSLVSYSVLSTLAA